jgi:hypothetical protein
MSPISIGSNAKVTINIAQDYTDTPGFRHESQGDFSGELFRKKFLEPYFRDEDKRRMNIEIIFDGTAGYPTSFLEEAFGGLVRLYGLSKVEPRLTLISNEDSVLIEDVKKYMREAK